MRNKDIKVNEIRVKTDCILKNGDIVTIFLPENTDTHKNENYDKYFTVVYEDENLLIVNKIRGLCVNTDISDDSPNLIEELNRYAGTENGVFLCHRIDRNTGGLVVSAKNQNVLNEITKAIEERRVRKYYQAIVYGKPQKVSDKLINYISKDENASKVFIREKKGRDNVTAITNYNIVRTEKNISLLDVEIETGRMHQIRVQFAHSGFPIIGDGKYGNTAINRKFREKKQLLYAYKLVFDFDKGSKLSYLNSKSIEINPGLSEIFDKLLALQTDS